MDQSSGQTPQSSDAEQTMNIVMLFIHTYSTSVEVFLHRHMGDRYLGFQAFGVLILVPFHAYFLHEYDTSLLFMFLPVYLFTCIIQRLVMLQLRSNGVVRHSRYNGFPILLTGNSKIPELFFKHWIEPFLVLGGALLILPADRALGSYLGMAGVAMFLKGRIMSQLRRSQVQDMQDAMFEQQQRAEEFRAMSGDPISSIRSHNDHRPW